MHNSTQTGPTQRMLEQMQAGETEATNTTSPTLIPHQSSVPSSRATHSDHNQHHETSLLHGANTSNGAGSINASAASFRSHRQNYEDVSHIQPRDHLIQGGRDSVSSLRHQLPYGSHSPRIGMPPANRHFISFLRRDPEFQIVDNNESPHLVNLLT